MEYVYMFILRLATSPLDNVAFPFQQELNLYIWTRFEVTIVILWFFLFAAFFFSPILSFGPV